MEQAVAEALKAGALGFSTSRATTHVTPDDTPVASRIADWSEIERLVGAMGALDSGIFQIGPDISGGEAQRACLEQLRKIAIDSGRPIMFGMLATKQGIDPNPWDFQTRFMDETVAAGRAHVRPGDDALDQRGVLAALVPAVRRAAGVEGGPRAAARRAEGAAARPRGARAPHRRGSDDEAARAHLAGRRRGDHRPAQARLRQSLPDADASTGTTPASASCRAGRTSTRSR